MVRDSRFPINLHTAALAALLAIPCGLSAQRGGGGFVGGGTAGGGGLSGKIGNASGIDVKDDLKDFHAVLAVQANSVQIAEYNAMLTSTEHAIAEVHALSLETGADKKSSEFAARSKTLIPAVEDARERSRKFLDELSERQKSGLKEMIKKLTKSDTELAQPVRVLDAAIEEAKTGGPQITLPAGNLERMLTAFRGQQLDLGEEMSIGANGSGQRMSLNLPPVQQSVSVQNRAATVTTYAVLSKKAAQAAEGAFNLEMTTDVSDLQDKFTQILRAGMEKNDACGERITLHSAELKPASPAGLVIAEMHYERWRCSSGIESEMAEGNGLIEVKLTPEIGNDGKLTLQPAISRVDAQEFLGELLRTGFLGEDLRDKIARSIIPFAAEAENYKNFPGMAQGTVAFHQAEFQGSEFGRLRMVLRGEIQISKDEAAALMNGPRPNESTSASQPSVPELIHH